MRFTSDGKAYLGGQWYTLEGSEYTSGVGFLFRLDFSQSSPLWMQEVRGEARTFSNLAELSLDLNQNVIVTGTRGTPGGSGWNSVLFTGAFKKGS
jgi:hypothetical protein